MEQKQRSKIFNTDMHALLPGTANYEYDIDWVYRYLFDEILQRLPGENWKGLEKQGLD
jgi:hypothetical protein